MICAYCGTELPAAAMFCGECGRAVATKAAAKARPRVPVSSHSTSSRWPSLVAEHQVDPMVALSEQPGLVEVDLLASGPIAIPVTARQVNVTRDEVVPSEAAPEEPQRSLPEVLVAAALAEEERERNTPAPHEAAESDEAPDSALADFDSDELAAADSSAQQEFCLQCGAELAASDIFCGECGFVRRAVDLSVARPRDTATYDPFPWGTPRSPEEVIAEQPEPAPTPVVTPDLVPVHVSRDADELAAAEAAGNSIDSLELDADGGPSDVEKTRIVDRPARGDAFILQFSTGENITVSGTGLIGRNPFAEPGEYFDSLVSITDPGKSVSKTHLEFGQDGGQFWISDRYSANGTVVREPDRPARRGEAGKRYRVVRGTRVDIGEQFFIVS